LHRYTAFGLQIDCEWPLPDLLPGEPASKPADVVVARIPVPLPPEQVAAPAPEGHDGWFTTQPGETLYVYPGLARFLVRSGSRIEVDSEPGVDEDLVRHVLLGPVVATLLWQRELLALHACVLSIAGRTCAFVANSGDGKSTLASALYVSGHRVLSDDVAVIPWHDDPIRVLPGYPRMKVYPDVLTQVGVSLKDKQPIHSGIDKLAFFAEGLPTAAQPLAAIYQLAAGATERVERLALPQALLVLMSFCYRPQQQAACVGTRELMQRCARVSERVPVFRLERPRDLDRLSELSRFVANHVAELA
jgi:hypothetical protein